MNELTETDIAEIIERVQARISGAGVDRPASTIVAQDELGAEVELGDGIHGSIDEAVAAAKSAQQSYMTEGLQSRHRIIDAIRSAMRAEAENLARLAHTETGLGRYEDKVRKNLLVANKTPGPRIWNRSQLPEMTAWP